LNLADWPMTLYYLGKIRLVQTAGASRIIRHMEGYAKPRYY
jgi:hypothetical protein